MKLDENKCKHCWGKRFYSVIIGLQGFNDFADEGFIKNPQIKLVACPKCNKGNRRKIKGVLKSIWN